jgi:hypothetical protein
MATETTATAPEAANSGAAHMDAGLRDAFEDAGFGGYLDDGAPAPDASTPAAPPARAKAPKPDKPSKDASDEDQALAEEIGRTAESVDEPGGEETAEADGADKDKKPAKEKTAEDELAVDIAELRGIRERSAKRKREKDAATRAAAAPAPARTEAAPAAATKKPEETAAPATEDQRQVARAVRDVIDQIAKLTADEKEAGAPGNEAERKAHDERAAKIDSLAKTAAELKAKLDGDSALTERLDKLQEKLDESNARQYVHDKIDATLTARAEEFPHVAELRNAPAIVYQKIDDHFKKHGRVPSIGFVLEKIEAVLARRAGPASDGTTETRPKGTETKAPKGAATRRNSITNASATPPAQRRDPDSRSKEEVERDLAKMFGYAQDDDE